MDADLKRWFETAVQKYQLSNYKIEISRPANGISGGFIADVAFAVVKGKTQDDENIELHLICKYGKQGAYREALSLRKVYEREIYFYEHILPCFEAFSKEKGLSLDLMPKCIATILNDHEEIVVMEDLKYQGYELYNKEKPMDYERMKIVIDAYAKFHAISFALRDQRKEEFRKLTANISDVMKLAFKQWTPLTVLSANQMYDYLIEAKELELAAQYKAHLLDVGVEKIVERVFDIDPEECIMIHSDPNNNNFVFKTEGDTKIPTKVKMLDWQMLILHSPAFDILTYLNFTSGKTEVVHFKDLLNFYYERLTSYIAKLGSNIEDCFPMSVFWRHVEKYSAYALLVLSSLPMMVIHRDQYKLDLEEGEKVTDLVPKLDFKTVESALRNRVIPLLNNYFQFRI